MAVERRFPPWMPNEILNQFLPPLQGGALLSMCPGVETPGLSPIVPSGQRILYDLNICPHFRSHIRLR